MMRSWKITGISVFVSSLTMGDSSVTLSGIVKDRRNNEAIRGAEISVDGSVQGISGDDGRYVIALSDQPRRRQIKFHKEGYAVRTEDVDLTPPQTTRNVPLYKDTRDDAYWSDIASEVSKSARTPDERVKMALSTWSEIETADLSTDSKAAAARAIRAAAPLAVDSSESLVAFATRLVPALQAEGAELKVMTPEKTETAYAPATFETHDAQDTAGTEGEAVKEPVQQAAATPAPAATPKKLPKTGSPFPMVGGLGLRALAGFGVPRYLGSRPR
jgi:hypothetical protein